MRQFILILSSTFSSFPVDKCSVSCSHVGVYGEAVQQGLQVVLGSVHTHTQILVWNVLGLGIRDTGYLTFSHIAAEIVEKSQSVAKQQIKKSLNGGSVIKGS